MQHRIVAAALAAAFCVGAFAAMNPAGAAPLGSGGATQVTVQGMAMPWSYGASLNRKRQFGTDDGSAAASVSLAALGASPGQSLVIKYVSGTICPGGGDACADAKGDASFVTDHDTGNSGSYFPSRYVSTEPTYLVELVGVYAKANGEIVGKPFVIPDRLRKAIPAGATQLQLGINDDIFGDNSGSWVVSVSVE